MLTAPLNRFGAVRMVALRPFHTQDAATPDPNPDPQEDLHSP
jgi:hypothetical protein